jgi:SAM-dependent methyltransferase
MAAFYSEHEQRAPYQAMLDEQEGVEAPAGSVRNLLPEYVAALGPVDVLEVGCGNGRLYRQLRGLGFAGRYAGLDMSESLIAANRERHPEARWEAGSVYDLPFPTGSFACCFSLYVLEHMVYPRRALEEMVRVLRPPGRLALVFPDFVAAGIFPSHPVGLSGIGTAREKLRAGHPLDAAVSLYDSRWRLPRRLARAPERSGPFPVNPRPLCLEPARRIATDTDAVYVASKREVAAWARERELSVRFPAGTAGELRDQAFLVIEKPDR